MLPCLCVAWRTHHAPIWVAYSFGILFQMKRECVAVHGVVRAKVIGVQEVSAQRSQSSFESLDERGDVRLCWAKKFRTNVNFQPLGQTMPVPFDGNAPGC